ncbi:MAG: hypothetical protein MRY21_01185 [Simkaniaceae bacterium]|nr:hypothetical protein [Simkaniaceae bacterium]
MHDLIALFGEAELGEFRRLIFLGSIQECCKRLGNPPSNTLGVGIAVQTLMFQRHVVYIRVNEEGYSDEDYFQGLELLKAQNSLPQLSAVCMPGVSNPLIIDEAMKVCKQERALFISLERDLYDMLTNK